MPKDIAPCVVITPVGPDDETLFERAEASVNDAAAYSHGRFEAIKHLRVDDPKGSLGFPVARNQGVEEAVAGGAEWVFFLKPDQMLMPNIFDLVAPYLDSYDGIWGATCGVDGGGNPRVNRNTLTAFQTFPRLLHRLANAGLGPAHFLSAETARRTPFAIDGAIPAETDYLLRLWSAGSCVKSALPFVTEERELGPPSRDARDFVQEYVDANRILIDLPHRGTVLKFSYTGRNAIIEETQIDGAFFEARALDYIGERIGRGRTIIDVGANTGNHALYFAHVLEAKRVLVVEPNPRAIAALETVVAENGLDNVDLSRLGLGVGGERARFAVDNPEGESLGAAGLKPDQSGAIEVLPLDDLAAEAGLGDVDFIKIDVEEMEIEVLAGALSLIHRDKPLIYVEVMDANLPQFTSFLNEIGYRVDRVFPEFTFANYFISPRR